MAAKGFLPNSWDFNTKLFTSKALIIVWLMLSLEDPVNLFPSLQFLLVFHDGLQLSFRVMRKTLKPKNC